MLNSAIANKGLPQRLSSDDDPLFRYHQWQANLRILEVEEIKSIPNSPTSHPFIERMIGNHVEEPFEENILIICFSETLKTWSESWQLSDTHNEYRPHQSLKGNTSLLAIDGSLIQYAKLDNYSWQSHCNGLYLTLIAA